MTKKTLTFLTLILVGIISFLPRPILLAERQYIALFCLEFLIILYLTYPRGQLFSLADWPLWIFIFSLFAGLINATNYKLAWIIFMRMATNFFLIFYIGKGIFLKAKAYRETAMVICICAFLVAVIAALELYFGKNILYEHYIKNPYYLGYLSWRPMSTQFNPAVLGTYLVCAIPFSLQLIRDRGFGIKILGCATFILGCIIIILTRSRGVFLGLVIALLFYTWNMNFKKIFALIISLVMLIIVFSSFQKETSLGRFGFNRLILGSYDSVVSPYRMDRIVMSIKIIQKNPIVGIGYGNFHARPNEYCAISGRNKFTILDNMYLTFLSGSGIVGLLGFLILSILLFVRGTRALKSRMDIQQGWILAPLASYLALLVNMGAYELLYWPSVSMFFCLLCGFIQGAWSSSLTKR